MTAAVLFLALLTGAAPDNRCTLCHPDIKVEFERSVHRSEEVRCVSCHGGDPEAVEVEAAHRGRFRGTVPRREIPDLCAECHSDTSRMRAYNLPSDQLALYQTSQHGRLLVRGDEDVAVCTDCHGVHEILTAEDPRSRVFVRNIPRTCAACHGGNGKARPKGNKGDPFVDYSESVHGKALLEEGNLSAPECSRCHSAHGAAPIGLGDVDKVCGQCHATTRAYFLRSRHKAALDAAGLPECAACHDHHRVLAADITLLDSLCLECHKEGSAPVEFSNKMKTLYVQASEEIERARELVGNAATIPLYVDDYRARLEEARTSLLETLPVMHALDFEPVEDLTRRARSIGHEVESELTGKLEGRKWRRVGLLIFWFYLLLTVAILIRFKRRAPAEAPP